MAGNHGDEYEGQVTMVRLIQDLEASDIKGRVIIMPAANLPAAMNGTRVSPLDAGNLNRAFPGNVAYRKVVVTGRPGCVVLADVMTSIERITMLR